MKQLLIFVCTVVIATAGLAIAADGPHDKAIKARQAVMQIYGYNLGLLSGMAKEKTEYNAELAAEAAGNLSAAVGMGQSTLWPPGSDDSDAANAKNRALPAIWETYPEIAEKGKALSEAVAALVPVAGTGLGALQGAMGDVGKSCKGCHDDFRAEKK